MLAMTSVKLFTVTNVVIVCNTGEGININTNKINNHVMVHLTLSQAIRSHF